MLLIKKIFHEYFIWLVQKKKKIYLENKGSTNATDLWKN